VQPDCVGGGIGLGIGTGVWGHSANADAQQHNINVAAKNITATGSQHEEKMEEMEFMAGIISRNPLLVINFAGKYLHQLPVAVLVSTTAWTEIACGL
jgi:hypothetical protein